jgi:hypothetical protein
MCNDIPILVAGGRLTPPKNGRHSLNNLKVQSMVVFQVWEQHPNIGLPNILANAAELNQQSNCSACLQHSTVYATKHGAEMKSNF